MTEEERSAFKGTLPVSIMVGEVNMTLLPKQFATGSLGWHGQGKANIHGWKVQCNLLLTVVGSKPEVAPDAPQVSSYKEQEMPARTIDIPDQLPFDQIDPPAKKGKSKKG